MKRILYFLMVAIIFITFSFNTFAAGNEFNIRINGKNSKVKEVGVLVDGQILKSEVPSFVLVDRTLVPIRFISENYGMNVEWENTTKAATITGKDKKIILKINSKEVLVNGTVKTLDDNSIPRLVTFPNGDTRTMVPLRFISEIMGFAVDWDGQTRQAIVTSRNTQNINTPIDNVYSDNEIVEITLSDVENNVEKLNIITSSKIKYQENYSEFDNRLFINIEGYRDGVYSKDYLKKIYESNNSYIQDIELKEYKGEKSILQIVITLKNKTKYVISELVSNNGLEITFGSFIGPQPLQVKDESEDASSKDLILKVAKHTIDRVVAEREGIRIVGAAGADFNTIELKDPSRIVLDFMYTKLSGKNEQINFNMGFIENVRVAQFSPDKNYEPDDIIVRLVLDIKEGIISPELKFEVEGNDLIIKPKESVWDVLSYQSFGTHSLFEVPLLESSEYNVYFDNNLKALVISVPEYSIKAKDQSLEISDALLKDVIIQTDVGRKNIYLTFRRNVEYSVLSLRPEDKSVKLSFKRISSTKPQDYLIVLDPGHGGYDPGAISVNNRNEKDVNFAVSTMVKDRLQARGYNVSMTREDDTGLGLYDRPRIANELFPDVFVSIHANKIKGKPDVNGIEVYYYNEDNSVGREDQKYLSDYILEETVRRTGARNRGVKSRSYVVVKYTNMPSSLIELGYLSNYQEEAKLYDRSYQEKLADGIVEGIVRYLNDFK